MSQNIYDDPEFFAGYSELPRSVSGPDAAPEWPALRALLPDLGQARVVDLGCGFGWFCRWAAAAGAASVLGVDISERMLERARRDTVSEAVSYYRENIEVLSLEPGAYDVAYSSLVLHYLVDLPRLLRVIHRALVPGGRFVFSVEHPLYTAPSIPGFIDMTDGRRIWPLDDYLREGLRTTDWLAPGVIKQHRTIATYVNELASAGFRLVHLEEWAPTAEQVAAHPDWDDERIRPPFLLVSAVRD